MASTRAAAAAIALAVLIAAPAMAAATLPEAHDAVPGHPGVTYMDLLRQVIPDLADNAAHKQTEGHFAKPPRHLGGENFVSDPPDPLVASYLEDVRIKAGGRGRIVLLVDLGQSPQSAQDTALMALYDDAPKPRLLDAVDVGVDKDTGFSDPKRLSLGPGDDALITKSEHSNSDQSYVARLLVFVRRDKFQLIDDVVAFSDQGCGWRRDETPAFTTRPDPGRAYRRIDAVIIETLKRTDEECGDEQIPKAYSRTWRGAWRWDAARGEFKAASGDLDRLDKKNEARF
jgi:hypothetical protein